MADTVVEETERADGVHGLGAWALAVVMGAILATLLGGGHRKPDILSAQRFANKCGRAPAKL